MNTALTPTQSTLPPATFDTSILAGQVTESTKAMYKRDIAAYVAFAGSPDQALQAATLARWRAGLATGPKSPNTINRMLSSVKTIVKAGCEQGLIGHDVAEGFAGVRGVKVAAMRANLKPDARTRIEPADMRRLLDAPDLRTRAGIMHRALLLTMASSGLRISELITLSPGKIKAKGKGYLVHVTGKTDIVAREAPISVEAYKAIQIWLNTRTVASGWIFTGFGGRGSRDARTTHITASAGWQLVKHYAKRVGLESIKPHDFRRFVGTTLAKADARHAQKALGHKNINTTYAHYVLDELPVGLTDNLC